MAELLVKLNRYLLARGGQRGERGEQKKTKKRRRRCNEIVLTEQKDTHVGICVGH
jgi:hypothetical protein